MGLFNMYLNYHSRKEARKGERQRAWVARVNKRRGEHQPLSTPGPMTLQGTWTPKSKPAKQEPWSCGRCGAENEDRDSHCVCGFPPQASGYS